MNETVLLIEDSPDEILLARRAFASAGQAERLRVAEGGEAACRLLAQHADAAWPALVLLDWQMPDMDGQTVLHELKRLREGRAGGNALPVAVLSSSDDSGDIDAAYAAGASCYLRKPVDFNLFVDLVRDLCRFWVEHNIVPAPQGRIRV